MYAYALYVYNNYEVIKKTNKYIFTHKFSSSVKETSQLAIIDICPVHQNVLKQRKNAKYSSIYYFVSFDFTRKKRIIR